MLKKTNSTQSMQFRAIKHTNTSLLKSYNSIVCWKITFTFTGNLVIKFLNETSHYWLSIWASNRSTIMCPKLQLQSSSSQKINRKIFRPILQGCCHNSKILNIHLVNTKPHSLVEWKFWRNFYLDPHSYVKEINDVQLP